MRTCDRFRCSVSPATVWVVKAEVEKISCSQLLITARENSKFAMSLLIKSIKTEEGIMLKGYQFNKIKWKACTVVY